MVLKEFNCALVYNFYPDKDRFELCDSNLQKINFFAKQSKIKLIDFVLESRKSDKRAIEIRKEGNVDFQAKDYIPALEKYTWSIGLSETQSTAALAYSNRSVILQKLGLHQECITDIDRALDHGYPIESQEKLNQRKTKSLTIINNLSKPSKKIKVGQPNPCININKNSEYGRHITASRDIEIGEVLLVEQPFSSILSQDLFLYCHECLEVSYNLIPCDSCAQIFYCSEKCKRKSSESYHKYEFFFIKELYECGIRLQLALRTTLKSLVKPDAEILKRLNMLESHSTKLTSPEVYRQCFKTFLVYQLLDQETTFFKDFPDTIDSFKELFLTHLQVLDMNAVAISRVEARTVGHTRVDFAYGLYPTYSLFNHSCVPNAFFYHEGRTVVVRAWNTIQKGEQCFISYGQLYSNVPKANRQQHLSFHFFFTCECRACEEDWPTIYSDDFSEDLALASFKRDSCPLDISKARLEENLRKIENGNLYMEIEYWRQLILRSYEIYENPRTDLFKIDSNKIL